MRARFLVAFAAVVGVGITSSHPSDAGHHLWRWSQVFSNASGSTQFAELAVNEANEGGVGPFTVTTDTGHVFNFVTNLPSQATANTWILLGTANLGTLPGGVAPDYVIPSNFFATGGGSLNYAGGVDVWAYGALPTDGVHALMRDGSSAVNSLLSFSHGSGSINLAPQAPLFSSWGIAALAGVMLLAGSGLLRRRATPAV